MVKRLRAERPEPEFTISVRIGCNADNVDALPEKLAAYKEAGVQHVMAAPEDRNIDTYLKTVERFARCCEQL